MPGLGQLLVDSIFTRDFPVIQALTLVFGLMVVSIPVAVIGSHEFVCQLNALKVPVVAGMSVSLPLRSTVVPTDGELGGETSCAFDCVVFTAIASTRVALGNCARKVYVAAPRRSIHSGPP